MSASEELSLLLLSLRVAVVATAINLPIALGISWLLAKKSFKGQFLLDNLVMLPLALPPVVTGYFLLLLLGRNGPIGRFLDTAFGIELAFTWFAASLAAAIISFPLMARAMMVAVASVDQRLERAARSLGAGPWRVFFTVTVPLAYRGILAGLLLGFVRAVGEFGATIVVAGNIPGRTQTLPLAIFTRLQVGDDALALRLVGIAMALAVVTLLLHNRLAKQLRFGWA